MSRKRGPGRPPLGASARSRLVTVKLTEAEYETIVADAKASPVSVLIRDRALQRDRTVVRIKIDRDGTSWHWIAYARDGEPLSTAGVDCPRTELERAVLRAVGEHGLEIDDCAQIEIAD